MSRYVDKTGDSPFLVCDERRHGIEIIEMHGAPGYEDERIMIENGLSNGLRIIVGDDACFAHFHISSSATARLLAFRLTQFADRIADPATPVGDIEDLAGEMPS